MSVTGLHAGCIVIVLQCEPLQKIQGPNKLQMHAWPAVWQGADVVGVSDIGKTTSYLLPFVSMLKTKDIYSCLPKYGMGVRFDMFVHCCVFML